MILAFIGSIFFGIGAAMVAGSRRELARPNVAARAHG
jgi:hypothetical protein